MSLVEWYRIETPQFIALCMKYNIKKGNPLYVYHIYDKVIISLIWQQF